MNAVPKPADDRKSLIQIAARLKDLRRAFGITRQGEFALKAGIARNTYNQWEQGLRRPDIENAIKLVEAYGVTLDWIFLGSPRGMDPGLVGRMIRPKT